MQVVLEAIIAGFSVRMLAIIIRRMDANTPSSPGLHQLNVMRLSWPADWSRIFGEQRPLIVEIGFGNGAYLLHLAERRPDANIIGLEISSRSLDIAEQKIIKRGVQHIRVVHSTAETALHHLFEPATIEEIHINFPDPWFKSRHSGRRLMQRATLDAMVSRLAHGGRLYLATDIIEYAAMCAELFAETSGLENQLQTAWVNQMPGRIVTKYEGKALREGRPCYYFAYRRNHETVPHIPVIKDLEMPHIIFKTALHHDDVVAQFEPRSYSINEVHIKLMNAYRGERAALFEVYIKEATIDQHLVLLFAAREKHPGEYTLKLSSIGHPRPTAGVHQAVALLGEWIAGLHPENEILKNKVRT
ncbi:MAG: tRNA (guanosine(46)-N7)-methyltransferase TrmB [Chloroflexi bacterium]|nr:MAG: tRNA (guanosine(46)-N7)-methyltransferase TrmB [Chloroflexota bacterium]